MVEEQKRRHNQTTTRACQRIAQSGGIHSFKFDDGEQTSEHALNHPKTIERTYYEAVKYMKSNPEVQAEFEVILQDQLDNNTAEKTENVELFGKWLEEQPEPVRNKMIKFFNKVKSLNPWSAQEVVRNRDWKTA